MMEHATVPRLPALPAFARLTSALLLASCSVMAAPRVGSQELLIATSSSIPPFVIAEDRGIVIDIMREALAPAGHSPSFLFAPNRRVVHELEHGNVDGVYNLPFGVIEGVSYSAPIVEYLNVAVSLTSAGVRLDNIQQLRGLRIAAFQNAPAFLGPAFAELVDDHGAYQEVANQRSQLSLLFKGDTDVIILEKRIFEYFLEQRRLAGADIQPVTFHELFPPAARYAAFREPHIREQFDAGLKQLQESGRYQAIIHRYLPEPPVPSIDVTSPPAP